MKEEPRRDGQDGQAGAVSNEPRAKKTLHELRTTGFRKLRPGRIHARCSSCGRKYSNAVRHKYDIPGAFLVEHSCPKCAIGKEDSLGYFDENGRELFDEYS